MRGRGGRVARLAIVVVVLVVLGGRIAAGVRTTNDVAGAASVTGWRQSDRQEQCLYRSIRTELPKGARVFITGPAGPDAQHLAEWATLWAVPEPTEARARWAIALRPGSACAGVALSVTPLG